MDLKGQRVLVVGAAASGLAVARFAMDRGARVTISDSQPLEKMPEARVLAEQRGLTLEAGGHTEKTFLDQDLVVASPGVPFGLAPLAAARGRGIPVIGEPELAARFLHGRIVGITGTNGKSTTTALAGKVLEAAGFHTQVGGNIGEPYGPPMIDLVAGSRPETINVVELSSFQLETIVELRCDVAVVLNVTPDHLDRHGSFEEYAEAKARIFANQRAEDFAVLNADDSVCRRFAAHTRAQVRWFSRAREVEAGAFVANSGVVFGVVGMPQRTMFGVEEVPLRGAHNLENVLAAVCVGAVLDAPPQCIRAGVRDFHALEHRLEFVAEVNGVEFYNDSKGTTVDSTVKAIEAFEADRRLLVILGGLDKGTDYRPLGPLLAQRARCALLIGSAAEKIAAHLGSGGLSAAPPLVTPLIQAGTLDAAVSEAVRRARRGDVVLLSPACASFDQFQSYKHRGRVFKELVQKLKCKVQS